MNNKLATEIINCPCCNNSENIKWAHENGFTAVKCKVCGLVYVNPRPVFSLIEDAVKSGVHTNVNHGRTAIVHRVNQNVSIYKKILGDMFLDVWKMQTKISWLDIGAGYGETIEAVSQLAAPGSKILGIEPMRPKAQRAKMRGLNIVECYLNDINEQFSFVSLVNVFSHIPDFHNFLIDLKRVLVPNGEFFIETGNIGDLTSCKEVPTELDLPDHLVFAGEKNIVCFLENAGFEIITIKKRRKDDIVNFGKSIIKKLMRRNITLAIPYTSKYRTILIRARLKI